jgi:L-fuculose-phosphate aldolase
MAAADRSNSLLRAEHFALWSRAYRVLDMEGHTDMSQGHLAIRDPDGRGFWMKRTGISFGEIAHRADFVLVDFDGKKLEGEGGVHGEWPIHVEILRRRPNVNAIGHTHPFHACVFSATSEPLRAVAHEGGSLRGPIPRYTDTSNLVNTAQLGRDLAQVLGDAPAVFMRNHGITFCGCSVEECVLSGIFLDKACRAQLLIAATGYKWDSPDETESREKYDTMITPGYLQNCWAFYERKLARREEYDRVIQLR